MLFVFCNSFSFMIYYPIMLVVGMLLSMIGLMSELFRAIVWSITFGFCCCLNRKKHCHTNLSIYKIKNCKTYEKESFCKVACFSFIFGYSNESIKEFFPCFYDCDQGIGSFISFFCCCGELNLGS
jgi:hypothetical protein